MEEKRSGEFVGAFTSYGYIKDKLDNHKLIIDQEAASIVRKIFEWKANEGLGNLSICHRLNNMGILNPTGYKKKKLNQNYNNLKMKQEDYSWSPSTIRNILKNDIYIGNVTQGKRRVKSYKIHKIEQVPKDEWITVENMHEPIIEKELFEKVQKLSKTDTRVQNTGTVSMWAGILKCADCKMAMHKKYCKNKSGTVYEYYICGTYRKKSNKLCTKHTIKVDELEKAVLDAIRMQIELLANIEGTLQKLENYKKQNCKKDNIDNMKKSKEREIEQLSNLKKGLYEDWKSNYITKEEYLEYKNKYEQDIEKAKKIIINLSKQNENKQANMKNNNLWLEDFRLHKNITKLDRSLILELIDYIEVQENKRLTIHFKFMNNVATKYTKEEA